MEQQVKVAGFVKSETGLERSFVVATISDIKSCIKCAKCPFWLERKDIERLGYFECHSLHDEILARLAKNKGGITYMNKTDIIQRLLALPGEIEKAEEKVIICQQAVQDARDVFENKKSALLLGQIEGQVIDGKNAEQREAQLRLFTVLERQALADAEDRLTKEKLVLTKLRNELEALKAVARILDREGAA